MIEKLSAFMIAGVVIGILSGIFQLRMITMVILSIAAVALFNLMGII